MANGLSNRIVKKIEEGEMEPETKRFLKVILEHELEHINESMWRYGQVYEQEVKKSVSREQKG